MSKILLNKSNVDLDYPICRPSLDLDFTQEVLDERITFSRGSIGTRVNRNRLIETVPVNQPRFDYDPVTGECKGLLIEESRQNLLTYSEDFSNVIWNKQGSSIQTNVITAPDNSTNADKIIENTSNSQHYFYVGRTGSNETVTLSVFAKAAERNRIWLQLSNFSTAAVSASYSLIGLGSVLSISGSNADYTNNSASIVSYPNGWYRCILTTTKGTVNTNNNPTISIGNPNTGNINYQGDGTSGIYIWGAQVEAGSFPTSYIPTSGSTVTRSADLASMTGTNFSSWYNQTEGTFYISGNASYSFQRSFGASIFNNASFADNRISIRMGNTFIRAGAEQFAVYPQASRDRWKLSLGLKQNDATFALDGSRLTADKNVTLPTNLDTLEFGKVESVTSSLFLNGTLNRFTYYPRRLKDNQLLLLTQ